MLLTPPHTVLVVLLNGFISGSLLQQHPLYKPPMFNFRSPTVLWRYVALKSMHSKLREVVPFLRSCHIHCISTPFPIGCTLIHPTNQKMSHLFEPSHECLQLKNLRLEKINSIKLLLFTKCMLLSNQCKWRLFGPWETTMFYVPLKLAETIIFHRPHLFVLPLKCYFMICLELLNLLVGPVQVCLQL